VDGAAPILLAVEPQEDGSAEACLGVWVQT
jgi:hypothetical protein